MLSSYSALLLSGLPAITITWVPCPPQSTPSSWIETILGFSFPIIHPWTLTNNPIPNWGPLHMRASLAVSHLEESPRPFANPRHIFSLWVWEINIHMFDGCETLVRGYPALFGQPPVVSLLAGVPPHQVFFCFVLIFVCCAVSRQYPHKSRISRTSQTDH